MPDDGPLQKESMTVSWIKGVQLAVQVRKHHFLVDQPIEEGVRMRESHRWKCWWLRWGLALGILRCASANGIRSRLRD